MKKKYLTNEMSFLSFEDGSASFPNQLSPETFSSKPMPSAFVDVASAFCIVESFRAAPEPDD